VGVNEYGLVWGTLIPQLEQVEVDAESSLAPSVAYVAGCRRNPYSRSSHQSIVIDESYHIVLHIKLPLQPSIAPCHSLSLGLADLLVAGL
jgi:hypothetical protein